MIILDLCRYEKRVAIRAQISYAFDPRIVRPDIVRSGMSGSVWREILETPTPPDVLIEARVGPHLDGPKSEYRSLYGDTKTLRRRCWYACDEKNGPEYVFASRDGRPDEIIIWRRGIAQSVGQRVASRGPLIWRDVGVAGFLALEVDPDRALAGPDSREPLPE